jgi:hypothetical protein
MQRLLAVTAAVLAGLSACQQQGPADTQIGVGEASANASPQSLDTNYLLASGGGYVLSTPPPGTEITVGWKLVRRADGGDAPAETID